MAPTRASLLTDASARAVRGEGERSNLGGLFAAVGDLRQSLHDLEAATGRIEASDAGLRMRIARVEGRNDVSATRSPADGSAR